MRVGKTRARARQLAAYALALLVALGVLGLRVMIGESRQAASPMPAAGPGRVEVAPPEESELSLVETAIGATRTR